MGRLLRGCPGEFWPLGTDRFADARLAATAILRIVIRPASSVRRRSKIERQPYPKLILRSHVNELRQCPVQNDLPSLISQLREVCRTAGWRNRLDAAIRKPGAIEGPSLASPLSESAKIHLGVSELAL